MSINNHQSSSFLLMQSINPSINQEKDPSKKNSPLPVRLLLDFAPSHEFLYVLPAPIDRKPRDAVACM
jgi:hypothetical protein